MTESIHSVVLNEFATTSNRFMQTSIKYHNYTVYISYKRGSPTWPFWFKWYKANTLPGSTFQGNFFLFLVMHGLSSKDKDPLLRPVSPCYLNSFKPSPRNHGQGFLAYFVIHSALGKSVSSPVMPLGQLIVSCCFDWFSVSSDVSINSPFLFYLLHKVVEACMHCKRCGCDSFVLVLTSCKCLLLFLMACIDLW